MAKKGSTGIRHFVIVPGFPAIDRSMLNRFRPFLTAIL